MSGIFTSGFLSGFLKIKLFVEYEGNLRLEIARENYAWKLKYLFVVEVNKNCSSQYDYWIKFKSVWNERKRGILSINYKFEGL